MTNPSKGKLIVLSGPSGVGKSTLLKELLARFPGRLALSVSATTRPPRPGEKQGVDYHFMSQDEFDTWRQQGRFLECFEVFGRGYWYGTPYATVRSGLEAGKWVILDIDVEGAQAVLQQFPHALSIFLRTRSFAELRRRLRGRGTESEHAIEQRLSFARRELAQADQYQYQIVNDSVADAVREISEILTSSEGSTSCSTP